MPVSGDLLGASSLLAALIGLFYSTWYAEINAAIEARIPLADVASVLADVTRVLRTRAIPLFVASLVLVVVITPPWVQVLVRAARSVANDHGWHYDAVQACFVAVYLVCAGLVVVTGMTTRELAAHAAKIRQRIV